MSDNIQTEAQLDDLLNQGSMNTYSKKSQSKWNRSSRAVRSADHL